MRLQTRLRMMLRQAGADEGWRRQVWVMTSKIGQLARNCYHSKAYTSEEKQTAYKADVGRLVGDIMVHCYIIAEQIGKPVEECFDEGIITFRDEMATIVKARSTEV